MNPEFFRIAATKTTDSVALLMLAQLERAAQELADADASFPERINANKAKRGENPTKLPKAKKGQLGEFAQDQIDLDAKLCDDFRKMTEPSQIVWSARYAMTQDLPNARKFLKYYHPDDLFLGEEIVRLKSQLLDAATSFLEAYPNAEG
jgi:hypothetical protein